MPTGPDITLDDTDVGDAARARAHPLFSRVIPLPGCVLTTRPHRRLAAERQRTAGGLYKPQEGDRYREEYGLIVTVLATGEGCWRR